MFCHVCALKMLFCFDMLLAKASLVCHVTSSQVRFVLARMEWLGNMVGKESFRARDPTSNFQLPNLPALCCRVHVDQSI